MRYLVVSNQIEGELTAEAISQAGVVASYSTEMGANKARHYAKDASRFHRKGMVIFQKSEEAFEAVK